MITNPIFINIPEIWEITRDVPSNKNRYPKTSFGKTFDETYDYSTLFSGIIKIDNRIIFTAPPFLNIAKFINENIIINNKKNAIKLQDHNRCGIGSFEIDEYLDCLEFCYKDDCIKINFEETQADMFKDQYILFTMFKNDKPEYIKHWIEYHYKIYNIKSFILFNNQSDKYTTEYLYDFLKKDDDYSLTIVNWPMKWGVNGPPWNADYCKIVALQYLKYKFAYKSRLVINLDIDEYLVSPYSLEDIEKKILAQNATTILLESKNISNFTIENSEYASLKNYYWFHDETVDLNKMYKWITIPNLTKDNHWTTHSILNTKNHKETYINYAHMSILVGDHHVLNNTKSYLTRSIVKTHNNKINTLLKNNLEKISTIVLTNVNPK